MTTGWRRRILWLIAGGALALLTGRWLAGQYTEWAFFRALGFSEIWRSRMVHGATLTGSAFALAGLFTFANLYAVRQSIVSLVLPRRLLNLEIPEEVPTGRLTAIAALVSLGVALVFAFLPHDWASAALAWDRVAFREFEPYLERDLGYYVAWIPWERALLQRATFAFIVVSVLVLALYSVTPSVRWSEGGLSLSTWVRRHLSVLAGLCVLLVGWDWRLDRYRRLAQGSGIAGDAGWDTAFAAYDHRIALPYLTVASLVTIPLAAVLMWAGWHGYRRLAFSLLSALILFGPIASTLLPLLARESVMTPEARSRERPYLRTSALFTRRAYGVEEVAIDDSVPRAALALEDLPAQVSLWDPAAMVQAVAAERRATPRMRAFWRGSRPGLEALTLEEPLPTDRTATLWRVQRFAATGANERGTPAPVVGVVPERIAGVVVYAGASGYALVADSSGRLAAPSFRTALQRVALAWGQQDPRLLVRALPTPRPELVTHRDVRARVERIAPFFTAGGTVTPVVRGDSLHWVVELFVTSADYPLSEALRFAGRSVHYARHAATAIVQAQTGRVIVVAVERPDAVTRSWMRRFPSLFTPVDGAPTWFRAVRPPALDLTLLQGLALSRVGFANDTLGRRSLARADGADSELSTGPETFVQLDTSGALGWGVAMDIPWSGRTLGLLVSRGGEQRRTEYYSAPGPRWTTVLEELQRAADVAGFGRGVPNARRGRVQAIPTRAGPAYVQSFYEWPPDAAPRLVGVAVLIGGEARAGRTIGEALGLRGAGDRRAVPDEVFRARVNALYDEMQAALRGGDWRAYGDAWAALGALVGRLPPR